MPLPEKVQREWKRRLLEEAVSRIARIDRSVVEEIRAPTDDLGYRNRVEFKLGAGRRGSPAVGFHSAGGGDELIDIDHCHLQHDAANAVLRTAREFLLESSPSARWEPARKEDYRLTIRRSELNGCILAVLRETSSSFPAARGLARFMIERHREVSGVALLKGRPGRRGGATSITLAGRPWIEERIGTIDFRAGAATFLQVSSAGAAELIRLVTECAGPVEGIKIHDLYGGVGAFGLAMLERGARNAVVCEADGQAVACGRSAARRIGERRISFVRAGVEEFLREAAERGGGADLIVANPPRAGLGPRVVRGIISRAGPAVVLVSCDPATLARDLRLMIEGGYSIRRMVPVDLFPQTAHIETVAHLVRQ
jgi:23S rRNA (uracil-5-)-methyltransferase RumA